MKKQGRAMGGMVALVLAATLSFAGTSCLAYAQTVEGDSTSQVVATVTTEDADADADQQFEDLIHDVMVDMLEGCTVDINQYLIDPEAYGVEYSAQNASWGYDKTPAANAEWLATRQAELERLHAIDRDSLTSVHQDMYDELEREIQIDIDLYDPRFDYYAQMFSGSTSVYSDIPTYLDLFSVDSVEDLDVLEALVKQTLPQMESLLAYAQEQADRGYLICDGAQVVEDCSVIADSSFTDELKSSLADKVDVLGLDEQTASEYKDRLSAAVDDCFVPAYQLVIDTFEDWDQQGLCSTKGLCELPEGRDYYEILWRKYTSSDMSIDEGRELLKQGLLQAMLEYATSGAFLSDSTSTSLDFESYGDMVAYLDEAMQDDWPSGDDDDYEIVAGSPSLMYAIGGFYCPDAVDGNAVSQIRINPEAMDLTSVDCFTTVAHEGVPGHMSMCEYLKENICAEDMLVLSSSGFVEGYASYAEMASLDYLDVDDAQIAKARAEFMLDRYGSCLIDIAVNYDGFSFTSAYDEVRDLGNEIISLVSLLSDSEDSELASLPEKLDEFVQMADQELCGLFSTAPGVYLSYGMGYLQFAQLEDEAEDALGDSFNAKEFREVLLQSGTTSFETVARNVESYIQSKE